VAEPVWEQRWHPLRGEWVLFTSHRGGRPWAGETHPAPGARIPGYDPTCALCPGNARVHGATPRYEGTYWFTNDLPPFAADAPGCSGSDPLYRTRPARGTAEVICYHPDHARTFALLSPPEAAAVVRLWKERTAALACRPDVGHVLIFENQGALVGTSNPHPHCQLYAGDLVYGHTLKHIRTGRTHFEATGRHLVSDIIERETPRTICRNEAFLACVPWFAQYAYEVCVLPCRPMSSLLDLDDAAALADILREVAIRYDNLWRIRMPYVMAIHQAPTDGASYPWFPFHVEFHPPLRMPDTLKYLAGPEIGGGSMTNESDPDAKAAELRAVPAERFSDR
jgi:UDPglucose--hexose-1-phosphate uridylyltransferase